MKPYKHTRTNMLRGPDVEIYNRPHKGCPEWYPSWNLPLNLLKEIQTLQPGEEQIPYDRGDNMLKGEDQ